MKLSLIYPFDKFSPTHSITCSHQYNSKLSIDLPSGTQLIVRAVKISPSRSNGKILLKLTKDNPHLIQKLFAQYMNEMSKPIEQQSSRNYGSLLVATSLSCNNGPLSLDVFIDKLTNILLVTSPEKLESWDIEYIKHVPYRKASK